MQPVSKMLLVCEICMVSLSPGFQTRLKSRPGKQEARLWDLQKIISWIPCSPQVPFKPVIAFLMDEVSLLLLLFMVLSCIWKCDYI